MSFFETVLEKAEKKWLTRGYVPKAKFYSTFIKETKLEMNNM